MDSDHIVIQTPTKPFEVSIKLLTKKDSYFSALCDYTNQQCMW